MFINYGKSLVRQTDWESSQRSPFLPLDSAHAVRNREQQAAVHDPPLVLSSMGTKKAFLFPFLTLPWDTV